MCETSLSGSCALISRWTCSTAANATSIDSSRSAVTSTNVPSSGRQRLCIPKEQLPGDEQPPDSIGHVPARQRRPRDIFDVFIELHRCPEAFANELLPPRGVADFAAVGLAIFEDHDPL